MGGVGFSLRLAVLDDVPVLRALISDSARGLRANYYTSEQVEAALGTALGVDTQLIRDGTYFVVEADGKIVACGGWSRRKTLFGSDHVHGKNDAWLDPAHDPAKIRAFFVHPDWARRGLGSMMMRACEQAARDAGFSRLELASTLPGVPLYLAHGFTEGERFDVPVKDGEKLPVVRMTKTLA
jgi:GNAT superfamily N-acetyltransferase